MREQINLGLVLAMDEDTVYAMPAQLCNFTVITSGGTIEVSLDDSTWQAITLDTNKNFTSSAPYVRCTGDDALIIGKAF